MDSKPSNSIIGVTSTWSHSRIDTHKGLQQPMRGVSTPRISLKPNKAARICVCSTTIHVDKGVAMLSSNSKACAPSSSRITFLPAEKPVCERHDAPEPSCLTTFRLFTSSLNCDLNSHKGSSIAMPQKLTLHLYLHCTRPDLHAFKPGP